MTSFLRKYPRNVKRNEDDAKATKPNPDNLSEKTNTTMLTPEKETNEPDKSQTGKESDDKSVVSTVDLKSVFKEYMRQDESYAGYSQIGIVQDSIHLTKTDVVMSDMVTNMLGCIVRYAGDELKLVRTKYSSGKADVLNNAGEFTLEEKCTKPLFELHDYPTYLLGENEMAYSFYKFEVDKCFIVKLLMDMAKAIMKKRSYSGFMKILERVLDSKQEEDAYLNESYKNNAQINNTRKIVYEEKILNKNKMNTVDAQLATCKNKFETVKMENTIKEEYIDKWELSRNKQNQIMYKQRLGKLTRQIKEYQSKIERELRVNREVERYTNMVHIDTEKELELWSKRHDSELDQKQYEIQHLNEMLLSTTERLAIIKQQLAHQNECIAEGRELRRALEHRAAMARQYDMAAVKIQAWWRGVRLRRRIAMLKRRKKRGGKKDAKGVDKKGGKAKRKK